ncbi:MAG TPA: hypothetical protein VFA04_22100 [Bryobacteraceae bacterium]|nr:hypothetical protein [Bryobacteraceae bacterium]
MKRGILALTAAAGVLAVAGDGIRPRAAASEYAARAAVAGVSIGAELIPPSQVRKLFATDLNSAGYAVVEIGIYPDAGRDINIAQSDFMLRAGAEGNAVRAASGETIAAVIADKNAPKPPRTPSRIGGVDVYNTAEIGVERGRDPVTGQRVGGVYGGAGVGVGVGGPATGPDPDPQVQSPRTVRDAYQMQQELENKALPEGKINEAIAGYVYFPRPSKKKKDELILTWYAPGGNPVRLTLQPAK